MSVTRDQFLTHVKDCHPVLTPLAEYYLRELYPTNPDDGPGNVWGFRTVGGAVRDWSDQMSLDGEEKGVPDLLTRWGCDQSVIDRFREFVEQFPCLGDRPVPEPLPPSGVVLLAFSAWTQSSC